MMKLIMEINHIFDLRSNRKENELQITKPQVGVSVKYEGKHRARVETNRTTFFVLDLSLLKVELNISVKECVLFRFGGVLLWFCLFVSLFEGIKQFLLSCG